MAAAVAAPTVASLLSGNKKQKQEPLETPEQAAARRKLLAFADTGQWGSFKAGEQVPLQYGDFNATGIEQTGLSSLQDLLASGTPEGFERGDAALYDFLGTDPMDVSGQFDPFKAQVQRQIGESNAALKRNAGFAGNLYSTDTIQNLGDIENRGNETLTAELARLTNQSLDRRLQAIPLAYQSAEAQEGVNLGRIGASQQYGGLTRQLNDASAKARDAELLRRRQELQIPINALTTVAGGAPPFGVPEVQQSPYQDLLNMVGQIGGRYIGDQLAYSQYNRQFPSGRTPSVPRYN